MKESIEKLRGLAKGSPFVYRTLREVLQEDLRGIIRDIIVQTLSNNSYNKPSAQIVFALKELSQLVRFVMSKQFDQIIEEEERRYRKLFNLDKEYAKPVQLSQSEQQQIQMQSQSIKSDDWDLDVIADESQLSEC